MTAYQDWYKKYNAEVAAVIKSGYAANCKFLIFV